MTSAPAVVVNLPKSRVRLPGSEISPKACSIRNDPELAGSAAAGIPDRSAPLMIVADRPVAHIELERDHVQRGVHRQLGERQRHAVHVRIERATHARDRRRELQRVRARRRREVVHVVGVDQAAEDELRRRGCRSRGRCRRSRRRHDDNGGRRRSGRRDDHSRRRRRGLSGRRRPAAASARTRELAPRQQSQAGMHEVASMIPPRLISLILVVANFADRSCGWGSCKDFQDMPY